MKTEARVKVRGRQAEKTQPEITGETLLITQVKEVCSRDQPELHSLSEGSGCDPSPGPSAPAGGAEQDEASSGVSAPAPPVDPRILPSLCCDLCPLSAAGRSLPSTVLLLPALSFPS